MSSCLGAAIILAFSVPVVIRLARIRNVITIAAIATTGANKGYGKGRRGIRIPAGNLSVQSI